FAPVLVRFVTACNAGFGTAITFAFIGYAVPVVVGVLPAIQNFGGIVAVELLLRAVRLYNLVAGLSLDVHGQVEAFVFGTDTETKNEIGVRIAQHHLVLVVDGSITVFVGTFHVAGFGTALQHFTIFIHVVGNFLIGLENAGYFVPKEI